MHWKEASRFGMKLALSQLPDPKRVIGLEIGSVSTAVSVSCSSLQKAYV